MGLFFRYINFFLDKSHNDTYVRIMATLLVFILPEFIGILIVSRYVINNVKYFMLLKPFIYNKEIYYIIIAITLYVFLVLFPIVNFVDSFVGFICVILGFLLSLSLYNRLWNFIDLLEKE